MSTEKPDYQLAAEELEAKFKALTYTFSVECVNSLATSPDGWKHSTWRVTIYTGKSDGVSLPWMQGTAHKTAPAPWEVLASCCREAISAKGTFKEWCDEYGYDSDSMKANSIYRACQALLPKLGRLLTRAQITEFAELASRL